MEPKRQGLNSRKRCSSGSLGELLDVQPYGTQPDRRGLSSVKHEKKGCSRSEDTRKWTLLD